jgi:hypothetical protein
MRESVLKQQSDRTGKESVLEQRSGRTGKESVIEQRSGRTGKESVIEQRSGRTSKKRLATLWLVSAAAFVLAGCGLGLSPEFTGLGLSPETPANPSVSEAPLAPGHKLVLPPPATYGSRIKVRQLVTIELGGNSMSFEALLNIQPSEVSLVAVDPLGRRALTLNWNGARLVVEKAPFLPDSVRPEALLADLIAVYWPAPVVQRALAATGAKVEDHGHRRIIAADGTELLNADYAWTAKSRLVGTMKYANLSWGYTVSVKSLEVKPVSVKPLEVKPASMKPLEVKPASVKPLEVKR